MLSSPYFQTLPAGPLDIIGDVHGEFDALQRLLHYLGYNELGSHPQGRKLVFVGDLCDRGPNSPAVLEWAINARKKENAFIVLGNHEINLLIHDPKDGSGWYFDHRNQDEKNYAPWQRYPRTLRSQLHQSLSQLPLILQRQDLRIVHAAWVPESIHKILDAGNMPIVEQYYFWENHFQQLFSQTEWYEAYLDEKTHLKNELMSEDVTMHFQTGVAHYDLFRSFNNPIRALTSGIETLAKTPFYVNGRWRFTIRKPWWQDYTDPQSVIIGHYWRQWYANDFIPSHRKNLFNVPPTHWLGQANQVYCIDFSVGARWKERKQHIALPESKSHLAALRWPEESIMLDNGRSAKSIRTM